MSTRMVVEVARWEFRRLVKWRHAVVSLLLTSLIGLGYMGGSALLQRALERRATVAVLNAEVLPFELPVGAAVDVAHDEARDEAALREAVGQGDLDGLLILRSVDEAELVVSRHPRWKPDLEAALSAARRESRLAGASLSADELADVLAPVRVDVRYHETGGRPFDAAAAVTAGILLGLMMMGVVVGSTQLFVGIAGEKQIRVTEQVVAAIPPQTWIDGKLAGHCAATLVSIATFGLGALLANLAMGALGGGVALPAFAADPRLLPLFALFSLLGLLLWFTVFAAVAATVDDPNTSSRSALLFVPFLPLGLGCVAIMADPDATVTRVLGIVPLTSPAVMPLRVCLTHVAAWEVLAAVLALLASILLVRRAAGRIFALGILMYGKEPRWSEVTRWWRAS